MGALFTPDEVVAATGASLKLAAPSKSPRAFRGVQTDSRTLTSGCLFVALVGEKFDGHGFLESAASAGAAGAVVAEGHPRVSTPPDFALFEVANTLTALGELGRAHRRHFDFPIAAVTGSNGKTTTKELIASILETRGRAHKTQGNLNNEVGVPLTLFGLDTGQTAAVIEMGMSNPGEIARLVRWAEPDVGLVTSVSAAHLAGMGSIEAIAKAKGELFVGIAALQPGSRNRRIVVNLDDARIADQARASGAPMLTFGRAAMADLRLESARPLGGRGYALSLSWQGTGYEFELPLLGAHNALNAAGAFAVGLALGYMPEECSRGLAQAKPHPGRLNPVVGKRDTLVLDDCYNANPTSMAAALSTLKELGSEIPRRRTVAVLGDMLELGKEEASAHASLGEKAAETAELLAFFGPRSAQTFAAARARKPEVTAVHFEAMPELIAWLEAQVKPRDLILVKGSRGMRLERAVEALTGRISSASQGIH